MAWSLTLKSGSVSINHGNVPFTPPPNVIIKNYTTFSYNYVFNYSGLGSSKKNFHRFAYFSQYADDELSWRHWSLDDTNQSTSASGSRTVSGNFLFDNNIISDPDLVYGSIQVGENISFLCGVQIYDPTDSDPQITLLAGEDLPSYKFVEWEPPQITSYTAYRANSSGTPDDAGTKIRYSMNASVLPLTGYGHGEFFIRYKRPADVSWTEVSLGNNITSINVSNAELSGNFPLNESYIIQFVAYDGYVSAVAQTQIYTGTTCMHFNAQKDGIGIGKYSEGAGLDVQWDTRFRGGVQFDNPIPVMANISTICLMENPISEAVPYNATTPRVAMFAWQDIIQTQSGYEILKNYDGTRNIGVIIPHDGFYRVHLDVLLSKESSSSAMRLRILQMPSTWVLPTDRNYLLESDYSASKIREITRLEKAWTGTTTMGAAVGVIYCNAGDKIVPTVSCEDTSKYINSRTVFSIQNIG